MIFDTPQVRTVSFKYYGSVTATSGGTIGSFNFNEKIDLKVEIDLSTDKWNVFLNGVLSSSTDFGGATEITAIRVTTDVLSPPFGTKAAIDNLRVTVSSDAITGG